MRLFKVLLNSVHFKMIEARKSLNNFDAKVTLGTTLTQFERIKHEIERYSPHQNSLIVKLQKLKRNL